MSEVVGTTKGSGLSMNGQSLSILILAPEEQSREEASQ
jgi:hypothetical protein